MTADVKLLNGFNHLVRKAGQPISVNYFVSTIGSVYDDDVIWTNSLSNGSIINNYGVWGIGKVGSCIQFVSGLGSIPPSYVYTTSQLNQLGSNDQSLSLSLWVNGSYNPVLNSARIFGKEGNAVNYPLTFRLFCASGENNIGSPVFSLYDGTNNPSVRSSGLGYNTWHHLVGVRDTQLGSLILYVSGLENSR